MVSSDGFGAVRVCLAGLLLCLFCPWLQCSVRCAMRVLCGFYAGPWLAALLRKAFLFSMICERVFVRSREQNQNLQAKRG